MGNRAPPSPQQSGDIYTVAGTGTSSSSAGTGQATTSQLDFPVSTASDAQGDMYIADEHNDRLQEVVATNHTQWGISMTASDTYTVAGTAGDGGTSGDSGPSTSALLYYPGGLALDAQGDVYVADIGNNRVQELARHHPQPVGHLHDRR